jgi:hypothetical protein
MQVSATLHAVELLTFKSISFGRLHVVAGKLAIGATQ